MDRGILITGLVLIGLGLSVFTWKVVGLELPILPDWERSIWRVNIEIAVRGEGDHGSVLLALPSDGRGQRIFGEHFASNGLRLTIRETDGNRTAVWRGPIGEVHDLYYSFNVQLFPVEVPMRIAPLTPSDESRPSRYTESSRGSPSSEPEIQRFLEELGLPSPSDVDGRVRSVFAFVHHELSADERASDDPLLTLAQRSGSDQGRERLFVTLLRAAGIPARLVQGLELHEMRPRNLFWTDVWVGGRWVPISASRGFLGKRPPDALALVRDGDPLLDSSGTRALSHHFSSLREPFSADELATLMVPPSPILRPLSLFRLPVQMQTGIRILLLFCASTVVVSVMRNLIGIPSYGTFMPALLALAMRVTGLFDGLLLVLIVIGTGIMARLGLDRLRLLFVPRLSIIACIVVLCISLLGLAGHDFGRTALYGGVLLPVVILTMLIERISILMVEEGAQEAIVRGLWSVLIAMGAYSVLLSETLGELLFAYPELIFVVMGLQVWIGGYTGYRLSELLRFRPLRQTDAGR